MNFWHVVIGTIILGILFRIGWAIAGAVIRWLEDRWFEFQDRKVKGNHR